MSARAFLGLGLLLSALSAQPDSPSPGGSQAPVQRLIAARGRQLAQVQRDERDFAADVREREKYCKDLYPSTAKLAGTPYEDWMRYCVWESSSLKADKKRLEARRKYYESLDDEYFEGLARKYGDDLLAEMADLRVLDASPVRREGDGSFSIRTPLQLLLERREERQRQVEFERSLPKPIGPVSLPSQAPNARPVVLDPADVAGGMPTGFVEYFMSLEGEAGVSVSAPPPRVVAPSTKPTASSPLGSSSDPDGDTVLGGAHANGVVPTANIWIVARELGGPRGSTDAAADQHSLVDYLRRQNQPTNFDARAELFERSFPGQRDGYRGSAEQNTSLLGELLNRDAAARRSAADSEAAVRRNSTGISPDISKTQSFLRYAPMEEIGVHGSFSVRVAASRTAEEIIDRDFTVAIDSAAAQAARMSVSGRVEIFVGDSDKAVQVFQLSRAWFPTIGRADTATAFLYAPRGTIIKLPKDKPVRAVVTVSPVFQDPESLSSSAVGSGTIVFPLR